ncbi:hypothetical protein MTR_4g115290 [Medicago truncatula]|uniref:Uncharacterized protein n=1 Tax=Medicago truncatula TaxID=3880 RepID=G7JFC1_MEDTR|nr:hypothetical protein MTR_4g115290 [Medicago truncatula]
MTLMGVHGCCLRSGWTSDDELDNTTIEHNKLNDGAMRWLYLNVVMEPYPDSDSAAISHAVSACLSDWNFKIVVWFWQLQLRLLWILVSR